MNVISEYYKDDDKAIVHKDGKDFCISFVDYNGMEYGFERFVGKSIYYVEDAGENWALGVKNDVR
ncbi:MAG: hypothetical protein HOK95_05980 [Candidatus Marinimicrobia bacterium]|jgi:hypothetical protein|nr:hypothetical protein [Candidatus Neomarinimicrobiota bacterium]